MDVNVWVSVCSWMGSQRKDLTCGIFKAALGYLEDLSLSILARRPHRELCPRKPARPEERTKDVVSQE